MVKCVLKSIFSMCKQIVMETNENRQESLRLSPNLASPLILVMNNRILIIHSPSGMHNMLLLSTMRMKRKKRTGMTTTTMMMRMSDLC
jgi:hypothetical protein